MSSDPSLCSENGTSVRQEDANETLDFERALAELEALVEEMERGDLPLEESGAHFERGMKLHRFCQSALEAASQKVEALVQNSENAGEGDLLPFLEDSLDEKG